MNITFGGSPVTVTGSTIKEGDSFPSVTLVSNDLKDVKTDDLKGLRVFVVIPSVDTSVCDLEIRTFNEKAGSLPGVSIYAISEDLPFAQARWCGASGVDAVTTLSDYKYRTFGPATGTYVEDLGLLTRSIFIVDKNGKVVYAEYVPEIGEQPNFENVFAKLQELSK